MFVRIERETYVWIPSTITVVDSVSSLVLFSPAHIRLGEKHYDQCVHVQPVDIYSLGVILWSCSPKENCLRTFQGNHSCQSCGRTQTNNVLNGRELIE